MQIKVITQKLIVCATLLAAANWAHAQTTRSWTGAAGDFKVATVNNWSPNTALANGDTFQWNATAATGNLQVTNASSIGGDPGYVFLVDAAHTGSLTVLSSANGNTFSLATNGVTIASGAGAVSFGNGSSPSLRVRLANQGVANSTHAWVNNSANTATINSDMDWVIGGGGTRWVNTGGTGNWNLFSRIQGVNSGNNPGLRVSGTGTVFYYPTNAPGTTYSGGNSGLILDSGTIKIGNTLALGLLSTALTLNGGTLDINGFNFTNALSGAANIDTSLVGGAPILTVSNAGNTTYNGILKNTQGTLSLTKLGVGALTLAGANTYSGNTLVLAGSLNVNGTVGAGTITVTNGATLGGTGTIGGSVNLQPGAAAIFSVTNNGGVNGTLMTVSGSMTLNTNAVTIFVPGATPLVQGTYTLVTSGGGIGGGFVTNLTSFNFTGAGVAPGTSSSISNGANSAVLIVAPAGITASWITDLAGGTGTWTVAPNWDSNPNVPTNKGDVAILGAGSAVSTVTVDADFAVGGITFTNPSSFTLASAGKTMTWDSKGSGATVSVNAGTSNTIATAVLLNDKTTVNVAGGASLAVSGIISGTSGNNTLTKSGNGTLLLSGANTYGPSAGSIGTALNAGTLELTSSQALGLGDLTNAANATLLVDSSMTLSNKIRITSSSTLTLNDGGNTVLLAGGFAAAGSLAKTGSGLVLFTNLGTSTIGGFGADNGVLEIGAGMTLNGTANGGNTYLNNSATLIVDAGAVVNITAPSGGFYGIGSVAGQAATNIINGTFNWPLNVALARNGGGVLTINNGLFSCNQFFIGQNASDSGFVYLNGGTLLVTNVVSTSTYGGGNYFYFNGGTLAAKGNNDGGPFWPNNAEIIAYASTNAGTVSNGGFSITIAQAINSDPAVGGTDGGLIFKGSGVTTLSGVNGYAGPTVVSAGRLMVNGSIGSGNVTVANGAALGGIGTIGGNINWQTGSSAYFVVTNSGGANATPLAVLGSVTLNNSNPVTINVSGSTPLPIGTYTLMNAAGITGVFTNSPSFAGAGIAAGTIATVSVSGGQAILTVAIGGNTWAVDIDGNWSTAADWSLNPLIPRVAGDAAVLGVGTAFRTVTLDTNVTITSVAFTNDNSFLVANGGRTLTFTNSPSGSGMAINVTGGISGGTSNAIAVPVSLVSTSAVSISSGLGSKLAISGTISGVGGLVMAGDGTGTLTLSGSNSYTAGTTLSAGTIVLGSTNAVGTGRLTLNGGSFDSAVASLVNANNNQQAWSGSNTFLGSFDLNLGTGSVTVTNTPALTVVSNKLTVGGIISGGTQTITFAGNGTLQLDNVNTFGVVNSGVGTLAFGNDFAAGSASTILNSYSPTAKFASSSSAARTIHCILGAGNGAPGWSFAGTGNLTFDGGVTSYNFPKLVTVNNPVTTWNFALPGGAASTTKAGTGTFVLAGANANTGGNIVNEGTLSLANSSALGTGPLTMNGGNLDSLTANLVSINNNSNIWNTNFTFLGSQSLNLGTGGTVLANSNIVVTVSSNTLTVGGPIDDGALGYGLTVAGAGRLVLNGANTYLALTTVSNGTLGGTGSISGPVQILTAGTLSPGASIGTLTVSNDLNITGNVLIEVNTSASPSNDLCVVTGGLTNLGVGSVIVSNQGPALVAGNSFQIFSKPVVNGNLLNITTNVLTSGLVWTNKLAIDGSIAVVATSTVATNPTNITSSVSGTTLNLSWPSDHLGWILQTQTNSRSIGLRPQTNQWFDVTGSSSLTNTSVTLDKEQPTIFFRLRSP